MQKVIASFKKLIALLKPWKTQLMVGLVLLLVGLISLAGVWSLQAVKQVQNRQLTAGAKKAQYARWPVEVFSLITFRAVPDIEAWRYSLILLSNSPDYFAQLQAAADPVSGVVLDLNQVNATLIQVSSLTQPLATNLNQAYLLPKLLEKKAVANSGDGDSTKLVKKTTKAANLLTELKTLTNHLQRQDQTWIVVLQNSQELRATGGFAGSYVLVPIRDGQITELIVEDIYDADGQFEGYVPPPHGVDEYLSSDNGLRLPDANWHPDFRQSSTTMLQFFALGDKTKVEGLAAINLPLVEQLLTITGPIEIADYQATLTAENVNTLLRSERDSFFPGSIQKKHLLSVALQQLRLNLTNLDPNQYQQLFRVMAKAAQEKQLLAYAHKQPLQQVFNNLGLTGQVTSYGANEYLYLLESNVGINKANQGVSRSVELNWRPTTATITVNFTNHNLPKTAAELAALDQDNSNQARHNGYINYQRVLMPPSWEVVSLNYNDSAITDYNQTTITTPDGQMFSQLGFLITLPEQTQRQLEITVTKPAQTEPTITLQKQPGLAAPDYTIKTPTTSKQLKLKTDQTFSLPNLQQLP